jgi:phosphatidylethanolamine/phosphatidyl-N-methylethanolamine N-methyltransferase
MSITSLAHDFHLKAPEEIASYFVAHKGSVLESLSVKFSRVIHFIATGSWISNRTLCQWAFDHKAEPISSLLAGRPIESKIHRCQAGIFFPYPTVWQQIVHVARFMKEFFRNHSVGSIVPSSKFLSKEIVSDIHLLPGDRPRRFLEIGPGTGAFTDKIIRRMNPGDELDLVELDPHFCTQLSAKYQHIPNVSIFNQSVLEFSSETKYDLVVSGLPLNRFSASDVQKIFDKISDSMAPGGYHAYFDYPCLLTFYPLYQRDKEMRADMDAVIAIKDKEFQEHGSRETTVICNVPPARVRHHQKPNG